MRRWFRTLIGFCGCVMPDHDAAAAPATSTQPSATATAESAKTLTGLATVNNANKIATRLVYDSSKT